MYIPDSLFKRRQKQKQKPETETETRKKTFNGSSPIEIKAALTLILWFHDISSNVI